MFRCIFITFDHFGSIKKNLMKQNAILNERYIHRHKLKQFGHSTKIHQFMNKHVTNQPLPHIHWPLDCIEMELILCCQEYEHMRK